MYLYRDTIFWAELLMVVEFEACGLSWYNSKVICVIIYILNYYSDLCFQEIDGKSLLLMKRSDVLTGLSLKLGPALKIYAHVQRLQTRGQNCFWILGTSTSRVMVLLWCEMDRFGIRAASAGDASFHYECFRVVLLVSTCFVACVCVGESEHSPLFSIAALNVIVLYC